jgi:small-conductance mechanosensitive channel
MENLLMSSLILGIDFLFSSWLIAGAIALLSVYFLKRTNLFGSIVHLLERRVQNQFVNRNSRLITSLVLMTLICLGLFQILGADSIQNGNLMDLINIIKSDSSSNFNTLFLNDLVALMALLVLLSTIPAINFFYTRLLRQIEDWRKTRFRLVKFQNLELLTPNRLANVLVSISNYVRIALLLLVASFGITLLFSVFPITEDLAQLLISKFLEGMNQLWEQVLIFLPNMFTLFIIAVITRFALKILRFFYDGLQQGRVRFHGIHPELIEPTYQLLRFLVVAIALVAAFPYIPGSSSPVFRGLSIFVGFLVSLGSTSLVTNIVSGIVLTYSRGLRIGDRVQIGETIGDVVDRTILVTRIRTIKNVVITIPNVIVMQNEIVNFSAEARHNGLILHTSVTIGYDSPWRQVQQLLINSALDTQFILNNPEPYVLKTSLNDHYVTYELNAFTSSPTEMDDIYSELHQNILDNFNRAKVEIMSPTYFAFRDGQGSTIPNLESSKTKDPQKKRDETTKPFPSKFREETRPMGSR